MANTPGSGLEPMINTSNCSSDDPLRIPCQNCAFGDGSQLYIAPHQTPTRHAVMSRRKHEVRRRKTRSAEAEGCRVASMKQKRSNQILLILPCHVVASGGDGLSLQNNATAETITKNYNPNFLPKFQNSKD